MKKYQLPSGEIIQAEPFKGSFSLISSELTLESKDLNINVPFSLAMSGDIIAEISGDIWIYTKEDKSIYLDFSPQTMGYPEYSDEPEILTCVCGHSNRYYHHDNGPCGYYVCAMVEARDVCDCREFTPSSYQIKIGPDGKPQWYKYEKENQKT